MISGTCWPLAKAVSSRFNQRFCQQLRIPGVAAWGLEFRSQHLCINQAWPYIPTTSALRGVGKRIAGSQWRKNPSSWFRERACLKRISWSVIEEDSQCYIWPGWAYTQACIYHTYATHNVKSNKNTNIDHWHIHKCVCIQIKQNFFISRMVLNKLFKHSEPIFFSIAKQIDTYLI